MNRRKVSARLESVVGIVALLLSAAAMPAHAGWDWATGPSIYDEEGKRDWGVEVIPYLWLAGLDGELGLPRSGTIPFSATFSSLASNLDAGFAGLLDLRYRRWHLISDNSWVRLEVMPEASQGFIASARITPSVAFGTVAVAYELPMDHGFAVDIYLGARWWHLSGDVAVVTVGPGGPFGGSFAETWADAVVGTRVRYAITDRWRVSAGADIGGGDASLDWSVIASVGYDFNDSVGVTAGYRVLGVDYSNRGFVYNVKQSGLLLGLNLRY